MASIYYIKAYYNKQQQQQQPEIRRFAIDISSENDIYRELCTKIATYQPDIQLNGFILQYVDEENERITFSSNDELRSAILTNKDSNALKVFVMPNQPKIQQQQQQQQQDTNDTECHTGVECDGCKGTVIGFRYKCCICPNYDLCEKCSSAGVHSEHNMIKISKPGNFYHPYGPRHHGRRHHRFMPSTPFIPNPEFIEQIQEQIPQWLPNRENTAHFRAHMQQHLDSMKTNTQTHLQNSKQYLESVGQYLQQALSPFGIDCDYQVDGQKTTTTATNSQEEVPTTDDSTPSEPSAVPKTPESNNEKTEVLNNDQQQKTISWLNMFRTNGTNTTVQSAASSETTTPNTLEKAVEDCVEKMKAMGFVDTNEALMELIRSKKGDLNSVLDAINVRNE